VTTWKGQEFEREWHRAMLEWIDGGRVGEPPYWQFKGSDKADWDDGGANRPAWFPNTEFRWAPKPKRTVTINGKVLVAPEVDAPAFGSMFFSASVCGVDFMTWTNSTLDQKTLASGELFLTREDAQAMADWLVKCRRGET
jgi:hypothetical protein